MPELFRSAIKFIQLFSNYIVFITKIFYFMGECNSYPMGSIIYTYFKAFTCVLHLAFFFQVLYSFSSLSLMPDDFQL